MSSMMKMWVSIGAIILMVLASLIITFARVKTKGAAKLVLSILAFILLIVAVPLAIITIL
jgi:hypothetical protein